MRPAKPNAGGVRGGSRPGEEAELWQPVRRRSSSVTVMGAQTVELCAAMRIEALCLPATV